MRNGSHEGSRRMSGNACCRITDALLVKKVG